jgi:Bacterial PH domain
LQAEFTLKSNVTKSFLKGTIALGVLSVFLQINSSTLFNYFIFLGIWYALLAAYILNKGLAVYGITETGVNIKRTLRKPVFTSYDNMQNLGYAQGMLAKRFRCGTVYIELKKGKGTHTASTGTGLYILRDIPNPIGVYQELLSRTSPIPGAT